MSINWESILPNRVGEERTERYRFAYNMAIEDCLESLKAAEVRGEICKPLSVHDVINIACKFCKEPCDDVKARCWDRAEAIHRAMTNKGGEK